MILSSLPSYPLYIRLCEAILQNIMVSEYNGEQLRIENESNRLDAPTETVAWESNVVSKTGPDDKSEKEDIPLYAEFHDGCVPLYTLRAACGKFEGENLPEEEGWVDATGNGFTPDPKRHFAIHAKGNSMLDKIKDGDVCVFEWYNQRGGSREGDIVLAEYNDFDDESAIKVYHSKKVYNEDGSWQHTKIELESLNKEYRVIELDEDSQYRTIGILKCVISNETR